MSTSRNSSVASFATASSHQNGQPNETPSSSIHPSKAADDEAVSHQAHVRGAAAVTNQEEPEWSPPANGPLKTPIPRPAKGCKPNAPPALTTEQELKYQTVLTAVSQWQTIPVHTHKVVQQMPMQDYERMWLTRECILRYLRATKWVVANALKRLQSTLSWRREYGADAFTAEYISPENETGKQLVLGYDKVGRPCLYLSPGLQNTKMSDRQINHLCFMVDRTVDMMPPGQESACLLINFKGAAKGTVPSVGQARAVLNILQTHSPERLGCALISELPWYVSTFFKLISPFIDPVTREKMHFNEDLAKFVPVHQLWDKQPGGALKFEYDHPIYWKALNDECKSRKEAYTQRWVAGGKQVGEYEEYLRGGNVPCKKVKEGNGGNVEVTREDLAKLSV
ncbi:CRAL/TRIO domain-containing protein [Piedraia hortae CBS 480.64]|uniref:CRAL/TRIO domain-containing protein n=1 Tax=Piedraia hortae CBS 480.64 TaxID=1314780 RepID=A0A6A7C7I2_9PEZI|nr:CRAL/TRIO domain-containing protein [Piedraia hortae CBS 480.64]